MARLVDGWLASRWPTLWSSRIHVSIARFVAFPILFALFVWTLGNSSSYASILAVVVVLSFFALLRTQEGAHYLITDARHETSVYVVHAVLTTSAALGATAIGAHDFRDGQERSFMLWFAVFLCAALQAVRSSSALVAFACVIVVPFIYLPFLFLVIASGASPSSATFYISLSIPMVIGASLLAWSIDRQARASVRRWFVSLTVLTAPLPALTCALVTGIESGKGATWSLLLSGLLVVVAMRLTLRFTEDVRRSLAIAAT